MIVLPVLAKVRPTVRECFHEYPSLKYFFLNTENLIYVFPEMKLRDLVPSPTFTYISVSRIGLSNLTAAK
jgi:hypothetical protein